MSKPSVVVLGGTGFIGRNLVRSLVEGDLVERVRVIDKTYPVTAYLHPRDKKVFEDPRVKFVQGNLCNASSIKRVFTPDEGHGWDYFFNLAGETKLGQDPKTYEDKVTNLSLLCAQAALEYKPKKWIEVSDARIYSPNKSPSSESSKVKPWTPIAAAKLIAENKLKELEGLNAVFVRPSIVYGPSDSAGLSPRIIIAAVYRFLGQTMTYLHGGDLKLNTVHVRDVCSALWLLADKGVVGDVYNLSDEGNSSQGSINDILSAIFTIKTGYMGKAKSTLATKVMKKTASWVNEKHLGPWSELSTMFKLDGPLTPYLDADLLRSNSLHVDGTKISKALGFKYAHPKMTKELIEEVIVHFVEIKAFPPVDKIPAGGASKKSAAADDVDLESGTDDDDSDEGKSDGEPPKS